jgi:hypothetical protein
MNQLMDDDRIDALGRRFVGRNMRPILNITFAQYLEDPDGYDWKFKVLKSGRALRITGGQAAEVTV